MSVISKSSKVLFTIALLTGAASAGFAQQSQTPPDADLTASYSAPAPAMTAGPQLDGIISARHGDRVQVTSADGTSTIVDVNDATRIRSSGGFLGLSRNKLTAA